jgi:hypothetical protein
MTATTEYPTIYDLLSKVPMREKGKRGRKRENAPTITQGLTPRPFKNEVGYRVIEPEELASLRVPKVQRGLGGYDGYQRTFTPTHAFNIAWAMQDGQEMENIQISLDEYGQAYITDGQHRVAAAVIARKPLDAVIKQRSEGQASEMFAFQTFAKKLDPSHMVKVSNDVMSAYVQDALIYNELAWSDLVHETSKKKLSPSVAHRLITMYGCNVIGSMPAQQLDRVQDQFDSKRADELADLIRVFGLKADGGFDRTLNPMAFKGANLRAIVQAAVHVFIRADEVHPKEDRERWLRHMPRFDWIKTVHTHDQKRLTELLLDHWNKQKTSRRVERVIYEKRGNN